MRKNVSAKNSFSPTRFLAPRLFASGSILLAAALTGCANLASFPTTAGGSNQGSAMQGRLHGGQQAVSGSHVHLMAAATSAYGAAATSLLNSTTTGLSDSIGGYVLTDATGAFSISNDYTCTSGQVVYALATQGNPGAGANNSALAMMTVVGVCPAAGNFISATPFLYINEVSTIATAYTLAGFMTDATHLSTGGSAQSLTGLKNAASIEPTLAPTATASALATSPNGLATIPQSKINTLANILATCVNSTGGSPCTNLFALAKNGSTTPTDTATAAINIAHNPGANVSSLYSLVGATANPFQPALSSAPGDWALVLSFAAPQGASSGAGVAIDANGNVWEVGSNSLNKLSPLGATISTTASPNASTASAIAISPKDGSVWVTGNGVSSTGSANDTGAGWAGQELSLAFDRSGNAYLGNYNPASIGVINSSGSVVNSSGYTTGGLTAGSAQSVLGVAVDSTGHVWSACLYCGVVAEMTSAGAAVSPSTGYKPSSISAPLSIAIDSADHAWISDKSTQLITEYSSTGTLLSGSGFAGAFGQIAIDGNNNVWAASYYTGLIQLNSSGATVGTYAAVTGNPANVSIDLSGNAWVLDNFEQYLDLYLGIATPVVTPINPASLGVKP